MPLLRLSNVSIAYGTHALLKDADFQLDAGERVGLLGRNGEGKSTLMKIIAGNVLPDHGDIWRQPELRLAWLEQSPDLPDDATIYDAVAGGLGELGGWITRYHELSLTMDYGDEKALNELGDLQHQLESHNGWHFQQRVETEIDQKVNKICLKFDLNESQRTKLFLAACHVKKEYFRQMDLLRQKWEAPQKDHMELFKIRDQVDTLRYQSLGPSTFFGKVLTRVLDEDASTIHQPNLNDRNFVRHCSNINSAVRIIERHVVLSAPQREALIELILKETRVPRFLGDYDDLIVQYRMSRLPDEKWQPLFSEDQWPGVRLAFEALRQCEPVLKRHGLINEEP